MTANFKRLVTALAALLIMALITYDASAQCCGSGGYSAYYPSYGTSYYGGYTSYYGGGGWYPGYWLNRVRTRLWGSPSTYVAGYSPYTVGYAGYATSYSPGYATSYSPGCASCSGGCTSCGYSAGYASSCSSCSGGCSTCGYSAGYAPCSTCDTGCSSCSQQVTLRPACECAGCSSGCSSCSGYSNGASNVVQTTYQQPAMQAQQPGCASCQAAQTQAAPPSGATPPPYESPQQQQHSPQQVMPQQESQQSANSANAPPSLGPAEGQSPGPTQQETSQKPIEGTEQNAQPAAPGPGDDTNGTGTTTDGESSTYFEAPKLFSPKDRTASRSIAPVRTALYEQPATMRQASAARIVISKEQAERDAQGWTSLSN